MSLLIRIIPHHLPVSIRKKILAALFDATAKAFECPTPSIKQLPYDECLHTYALFTREQAEKALQSGRDASAIKNQLYQKVYPLGKRLRNWTGASTMADVIELGQILYQAIGVEIQGDTRGNLLVKRCYFSQFYSAPVCDLISGLDEGLFSGLAGGGRLSFSERLTEGMCCCKAKLQLGKEGNGK